jgi:hypothetical protein
MRELRFMKLRTWSITVFRHKNLSIVAFTPNTTLKMMSTLNEKSRVALSQKKVFNTLLESNQQIKYLVA